MENIYTFLLNGKYDFIQRCKRYSIQHFIYKLYQLKALPMIHKYLYNNTHFSNRSSKYLFEKRMQYSTLYILILRLFLFNSVICRKKNVLYLNSQYSCPSKYSNYINPQTSKMFLQLVLKYLYNYYLISKIFSGHDIRVLP